ncbi:TPA: hypothetical protein N3K56_003945 [Klebsiella aerogenes]|uniref:hypothetical protein n=1 Tax=Klebsiella aerogenes TaxID=548 RepID=UPI003B7AA3A4|nr:hypothetical protein [Klebsiella aerogenes]
MRETKPQIGKPAYAISQASICGFEAGEGSTVPGDDGLFAYAEPEEYDVFQLED